MLPLKASPNLELMMYLVDTPEGHFLLSPEDKIGIIVAMEKGQKVIPLFRIVAPTHTDYSH